MQVGIIDVYRGPEGRKKQQTWHIPRETFVPYLEEGVEDLKIQNWVDALFCPGHEQVWIEILETLAFWTTV